MAKDFDIDAALDKQAAEQEALASAGEWGKDEEVGSTLKGVFLKAYTVTSDYGTAPVIIVKDIETGENVKVFCSRTTLRSELFDLQPKPGSLIGIRYGGQQESANGRMFHLYTMVAEKRDEEFWAEIIEDCKPVVRANPHVAPDEAPF